MDFEALICSFFEKFSYKMQIFISERKIDIFYNKHSKNEQNMIIMINWEK